MKKQTLLGGEDVLFSSLGVKEETFNEQFSEYLRKRFKEYRERNLQSITARKSLCQSSTSRFSHTGPPSHDGKEFCVLTANNDDYEFDVLKIDRTGIILKNLTGGFTSSYDYLTHRQLVV